MLLKFTPFLVRFHLMKFDFFFATPHSSFLLRYFVFSSSSSSSSTSSSLVFWRCCCAVERQMFDGWMLLDETVSTYRCAKKKPFFFEIRSFEAITIVTVTDPIKNSSPTTNKSWVGYQDFSVIVVAFFLPFCFFFSLFLSYHPWNL